MSSVRKRDDPPGRPKGGRKRPRLEANESPHSEQEISVHVHPDPYEDDFDIRGESDLESPEREERSPNVTLEPGLDISIDSPAFPLSKASQMTSKLGRRHYRGGSDVARDPPHLTKSSTLPIMDSRRKVDKDRYSRSRSKSPYASDQGLKSRIVKRNVSSGKNSPMPEEFEQDPRYSDQYRGGDARERPRSKHSRSEPKSRLPEYREYESRRGSRGDIRMSSRDQNPVDSRSRGKEYYSRAADLSRRKDKGYPRGEDRSVSSFKRRSPSRREGERYSEQRSSRRGREEHCERSSREGSRRKRKHHHRHSPRPERKSHSLPVVLESGSGDEGAVKAITDDIEDLIKDIEETSSSSSSEEEMEETKEERVQSPESVSSHSFSSLDEGRADSASPDNRGEERGEQQGTGERESDSEGEIHSPIPPDPYVMRSRFDTSDHSESDEDTNQGPSQHSQYVEVLSDEGSGASAVHSPEPTPDKEADLPTPHESPEPPPVPILPPYLPALMGCKNVESYEWLDRIEEGTYGVVYKAKDKRTGDIVALKKLKMEKEKEGFPITSLREINMLLKAAHPNIVPVREIVVGSNMDKIYIVMDFIKHDLKALMSTMKEKFLEGEVKTLMMHLLRAVHHMHDNWILHRDLKTSNLLLSHDNILKVADFGLAREYGSPLLNYTPVVVTLWYRSPELLLGVKEYSTAVDIWSVGCIFAELLLHKALFPGRSEIDQLNKIFTELGTPNEKIWPGFKQLAGAKNVTFTHHPQGNLRKKHPSLTTQNGFDLLFKLLTYDPKTRITAKDALDHQYFKEMPRPVPPEMFPTWPTKGEITKNKRKREKSPTPPEGGAFVLKGADQGSPGPGFSLKF